jgi:hypothetical protein
MTPAPAGPQRRDDHVAVRALRVIDQPVDAVCDSLQLAGAGVVGSWRLLRPPAQPRAS